VVIPVVHGSSKHVLALADPRKDLRDRLAGYKIPTLLHIADIELRESMKIPEEAVEHSVLSGWWPADPGGPSMGHAFDNAKS
jgi:hypothetical protein